MHNTNISIKYRAAAAAAALIMLFSIWSFTSPKVNAASKASGQAYSSCQLKLTGLGDWNFATATYNRSSQSLNLRTNAGQPHVYFSDTYVKIAVTNAAGAVKFQKDYKGNYKNSYSSQNISLSAGDRIKVYAAEPTRAKWYQMNTNTAINDMCGDSSEKNMTYEVTASGLKKIKNFDHQIQMKGLGDNVFAVFDYNADAGTIKATTNEGQPHVYFSSLYAGIIIKSESGAVKYTKYYVGNAKQKYGESTVNVSVGDKITIYYAERTRLQFFNAAGAMNTSLTPDKDNKATTYQITDNGFVKYKEPTTKPAAPATLKAAKAGTSGIDLSWTASANAAGYKIYRADSAAGSYTQIATVTGKTNYSNTGLSAGKDYFYKITAYNSVGESSYSSVASAKTDYPTPNAPTGVTATGSNANITVKWGPVTGSTSYAIYRSTNASSGYAKIADATGTQYVDSSAPVGTKYYYKISAYNGHNYSSLSAYAAATRTQTDLSAPTNLKASRNGSKVDLSWNAVTGSKFYVVYRSESLSGSFKVIAIVSGNTATDTAATANITYYYKVKAWDMQKFSEFSNYTAAPYKQTDNTVSRRAVVMSAPYDGGAIGVVSHNAMVNLFSSNSIDGSRTATTSIENTTKENMMSRMHTALDSADSNDVSYIYINCHGGSNSYLALGSNGGMTMQALRNELDKIKGKKVVMIESCHSGNAVNLSLDEDSGSENSNEEMTEEEYSEQMVSDFMYPDGIAPFSGELLGSDYKVICSSSKTELSWAWVGGYAWATRAWCDGAGWNTSTNAKGTVLADKNSDGKASLSELYNYSYPIVKAMGGKNQSVVCAPQNDTTPIFQ